MEPEQRRTKQREMRQAIADRLTTFYSHVKSCVDVDCEDFYRRVLEQAKSQSEHRRPA